MRGSALVALLVAATPAGAQSTPDWPLFHDNDGKGISMAVDPASIKADGSQRSFRGRLGKEGDPRQVMLAMVADCQARTIRMTSAQMYLDGKPVETKDSPVVHESRSLEGDAQGLAMLAYVCKKP